MYERHFVQAGKQRISVYRRKYLRKQEKKNMKKHNFGRPYFSSLKPLLGLLFNCPSYLSLLTLRNAHCKTLFKSFTPQHQYVYSSYCSLHTCSKMLVGRICFSKQQLLWFVIISFILITLMFDPELTLY